MLKGRPLRVHEAAFLLRMPENEVRRRIARGELAGTWAGAHQRVSLEAVRLLVVDDALATLALDRILEGRLQAPRASRPSQVPSAPSTIARSL